MNTRRSTAFRVGAVAFALAFVLHNADHFRRGLDVVTPYVLWGGVALGTIAIVSIVLVAIDHAYAPPAAVVAGVALGLGAAASHLLPTWSVFSDPLWSNGADAFTWAAVVLEVGMSLVFAFLGWQVLSRHQAESDVNVPNR